MAPNASYLTNPKYGYDFVVATTQESINAGLIQYLQNTKGKQPVNYLCFLADQSGSPTKEITLDELKKLSGGISPFGIPDGTDWQDPRIQKLMTARFVCAIKMQSGIPPGMIKVVAGKGPQLALPEPVVTLGDTASNVLFNMYCSDVSVVLNTPPSGWGGQGSWKWFSQRPGTPWYVQTRTNITVSDLDKNLKTPYFDEHTDERDALKKQLVNMSSSAFSLQQLYFNLDSAIAQTTPTFKGVVDPQAEYLLGMSFIRLWSTQAKERGLPLIGVSAVAQVPDGTPLRVTGMERWVSPVVDPSTGIKLAAPTEAQLSATTLNYLCAANGHALPGASNFNWNWIEPADVEQSSGVIAIKRNTIAEFIVEQMLPQAKRSCLLPWSKVHAKDVSILMGINLYVRPRHVLTLVPFALRLSAVSTIRAVSPAASSQQPLSPMLAL